jgi:hypothetical protein
MPPSRHKPVEVSITRDLIRVRSVRSHLEDDDVGFIRVTQFNEQTTDELKKAIRDLTAQSGDKLKCGARPRNILGSVTVDAGVCEPKGAHQLRWNGRAKAVISTLSTSALKLERCGGAAQCYVRGDERNHDVSRRGGPPTPPPTPLIYWGDLSVTGTGDLPLATQRRVESIASDRSPFAVA